MSTIDQQFVEYVVKTLVEHPDDVQVERIIDEKGVLLTLTVNPEDLGRVIGRRGSNASSLRTLLRALGAKNEARYNLKIVDNKEQNQTEENKVTENTEFQAPQPQTVETEKNDFAVENPIENETKVDNLKETIANKLESVEKSEEIEKLTHEDLAKLDQLDI